MLNSRRERGTISKEKMRGGGRQTKGVGRPYIAQKRVCVYFISKPRVESEGELGLGVVLEPRGQVTTGWEVKSGIIAKTRRGHSAGRAKRGSFTEAGNQELK